MMELQKKSHRDLWYLKRTVFDITNYSVISLLASYYVFHVDYPTSVPPQSLLLFLQDVLQWNQGPKRRQSIMQLLIKKLIKNTAEES